MFDQTFKLSDVVRLYVPSTVDGDQEAPEALVEKYTDLVLTLFSKWFGGATITTGKGGWYSDNLERVITEDVTIITSFCDPASLSTHEQDVMNLANELKESLKQEAISLEHNNVLHLV